MKPSEKQKVKWLLGAVKELRELIIDTRKQVAALAFAIDELKKGPPAARVERVDTNWSEGTEGHIAFRIRY